MFGSQRIAVIDSSQVGSARRLISENCAELEFNGTDCGRAAVVVSELASNLVRHGGGGEIVVTRLASEIGEKGLQVISIDRGAGISKPERCLEDGYSTAGSPGTGLGAIRRMSDSFDFDTDARGTVLPSRIWGKNTGASKPPQGRFTISAISLPLEGETECGDAWTFLAIPGWLRIFLVDGLGHGHFASEAAKTGIAAFEKSGTHDSEEIFTNLHAAMFHTRGAAASLADVDFTRGGITFTGIGNVAGVLLSDQQRSMASMNGVLGSGKLHVRSFNYLWTGRSVVVLHSDGMNTHWRSE